VRCCTRDTFEVVGRRLTSTMSRDDADDLVFSINTATQKQEERNGDGGGDDVYDDDRHFNSSIQ
jgi:hypothetical protein